MTDTTSRERALAAERLASGTSFPIMQAARMFGVELKHAYLIYEAAKVGMAGYEPCWRPGHHWLSWAQREAAEDNHTGAIDFYWWACSHLAAKRRAAVLERMGEDA